MEKSKVFFTDMRTHIGTGLTDKLEKLIKQAGMMDIDFNKQFIAVKIHFGEDGNLAYIRPNYPARVVKLIKQAGGKPFLTDTNTLYKGARANAVDHLEIAHKHGFMPYVVDCPVVIADGLRGADYQEIEVNKKHITKAKIGSAIAEADIIITLNHFKGHELTGFGGALKNLGMGCGSVGGKLEMHSVSKPIINRDKCIGCRVCEKNCSQDAISMDADKKAVIDYDLCVGCGQCIAMCRYDAACVNWDGANVLVNERIAEYALAVVTGKPAFHINFVMNISPDCDCWPRNDAPLVADIGIAASYDPVALDQACADMVTNAPRIRGTIIDDKHPDMHGVGEGEDKIRFVHPDTDWTSGIAHGEAIGLGHKEYELIRVK